jgi:HlyD family secretion protein
MLFPGVSTKNAERTMKKILAVVIVIAVLAGGGFWYWNAQGQTHTRFTLAAVKRGRLEATVGSTGTLEPREIVDVGAQVVGRIIFIGQDPNTQSKIVDWGSEVQGPEVDQYGHIVKPGTLLAQIDPDLYEAQVLSAEASISSSEAAVKSAEAAVDAARADLLQKTATLTQATKDWNRAEKLIKTEGVAQAEYDQFLAAYEVAKANFKSSSANIELNQANVKTAQAAVRVAEANLKTAKTNLAYTKITAPVKGVVIDRRVNVGQTVVASLSAPSLFLIAKDLSKTEVWATVNEVDVGKIKIDSDGKRKNVTFTVDAYPGKVYHGRVVPQGKLPFRLNANNIQNVVTYTVVVSVDDEENKDGALRPYMTANLTFLVGEKDNALLVPNAALRWQPARNQIAPEVREALSRIRGKRSSPSEAQDRGIVWVKGEDGYVRFVEVRTGLSDSVNTEIVGVLNKGELPEHTPVIVGETRGGEAQSNGSNPFVASPFGPKKKD